MKQLVQYGVVAIATMVLLSTLSAKAQLETEAQMAGEANVYSVAPANVDKFISLQARMHERLKLEPGFIGSMRGQGANPILAHSADGGQISTALSTQADGSTRNNVFIDYIFWQRTADMHRAANAIANEPLFQEFAALIDKGHGFFLGGVMDGAHFDGAATPNAILEVAFYRLKQPFADGLKAVRPPIMEWLQNLPGYRGLITFSSEKDSKEYADIVVWTNLKDAEDAANALSTFPDGQAFNDEFELVRLYGHFAILGLHG